MQILCQGVRRRDQWRHRVRLQVWFLSRLLKKIEVAPKGQQLIYICLMNYLNIQEAYQDVKGWKEEDKPGVGLLHNC